jgi:hypothetical protein
MTAPAEGSIRSIGSRQQDANPQPVPAVGNASGVVQQLKKERERAQEELKSFDAAIAALGATKRMRNEAAVQRAIFMISSI